MTAFLFFKLNSRTGKLQVVAVGSNC